MATPEKKDHHVGPFESARKTMFKIKELLLTSDEINIIAGTNTSPIAARAAETLVRLGYITYSNIQTLTSVDEKDGRRKTNLIITVKKTADFKKLYDENEAKRKEREAERAKTKETKEGETKEQK